jgi:DNA-binding transcriptional MerR regulator
MAKNKTISKSKQVKPKPICIECNDNTKKARSRQKIDVILCDDCKKLDKYNLMTKTYSKTTYFLTDDDIIDLKFINANSSYGQATYYTIEDIKNVFCEKYDITPENINNKLEELNEQKKFLQQEKMNKKEEKKNKRYESLTKALNKAGLELRNDSKSCENYIDGKIKDKNISDIVERMCQMKYLFEYCHMDECKEEAYKEYNDTLNAGYFPDFDVFDEGERIALEKYSNGEYPDIYPWIKKDDLKPKKKKK